VLVSTENPDGLKDAGRELCDTCHTHHRRAGTLCQFRRKTWPAAELVAEADALLEYGVTHDEIARATGVQWNTIRDARARLKRRAKKDAEKEAGRMAYSEHDKLKVIAPFSHRIGEFLEWLPAQGVRLMRWVETVDVEPCDGTILDTCRGKRCERCKGANVIAIKRKGWIPHGESIQAMLAAFFEIDQDKIEVEKRHMLAELQKRNEEKQS
jgi:transposase-like protein